MIYTAEQARKYRECDELPDKTRERFGGIIQKETSLLSTRSIVLDIGCGTGRYFQYVNPTCWIVGVDPSDVMLREAKKPAGGRRAIGLVCDTIEGYDPNCCFDFAYSVGVLAEHIDLTLEVLTDLYWWSTGKVFFTAEKIKDNKPTTISYDALENLLIDSQFEKWTITEWETDTPHFKGTHFEVIAE